MRVTYVNFDGRFCRYFTPERYAQLDDDYIKEVLSLTCCLQRLLTLDSI